MNTIEQALRQLRSAQDLNELKQLYRAFALQFHPDHGGTEEGMKAINIEFTRLFEILKTRQNETAKEEHSRGNWKGCHETTETPDEFIEIVEKLSRIQGINIELCGAWLWISGDTLRNQRALKACGCLWSSNKKMWYWRHKENYCRKRTARVVDMNEIRAKYGSQTLNRRAYSVAVTL